MLRHPSYNRPNLVVIYDRHPEFISGSPHEQLLSDRFKILK